MLEGRVVLEAAAGNVSREQVTEAYFGLRRSQHRRNEVAS
jgi:hypothetical protein